MRDRSPSLRPFAALVAGSILLAAGIALARLWLPEWRGEIRDKFFYVQRYQELASRAGVRLHGGEPRAALTVKTNRDDRDDKAVKGLSTERASTLGAGLRIEISHPGTLPGARKPQLFRVDLSPDEQPLVLTWTPAPAGIVKDRRSRSAAPSQDRIAALSRLLLAPGERLGARQGDGDGYELPGSDPPQHLEVDAPSGEMVTIRREPGSFGRRNDSDNLATILEAAARVLGVVAVVGLFFFLILRRQIDFANGRLLGALSFAVAIAGAAAATGWMDALGQIGAGFFLGLWIVVAWSVGESYLRSIRPGFSTSLDALRERRLGPRGGRALLNGVALGAALAGLVLATLAVAARAQGTGFQGSSLRFPVLGAANPFSEGILLASATAVALGLALRFLPERWAPWAAAAAGGLVFSLVTLPLEPQLARLAASVAMGGFLVWVLRRLGLTALLVTALSLFLLPAAVFSALHLAWLGVPFIVTAAAAAALLTLGWMGLRQSEQIEVEGRRAPAFIRRIEEERRLRHEMDLLARMQIGLLPAQLPEVPGWEIAVRSLLATEAGGDLYDFLDDERGDLWIAAGDVAGHGYSCSIAQAMTAASLSSLVGAGQTPSGVLQRIDRVLRRNGAHRNFTTLALLRLDPKTGEGHLANAGHPFPLLVLDGEVSEISLAGLPLGQGPKREYNETTLQIPPGAVLVFCSDGLFEGADWQSVPYGYDRPRELLRTLGGKPAAEILEALLADWRRHLGAQEHQDDTTVVVVKRTT